MLQRTGFKLFLFVLMVSAFVSGGFILTQMLEEYMMYSFALIVVGLLIALFFVFTPCRKCGKPQGFKVFGFIIAVLPIGLCLHCGESYLFEDTDTSHQYVTTYSYVGMPLKVLFTYGEKDFRFFAGIGIVPQMFVRYQQDREWMTTVDETIKESEKTKSGYNSFVLSAVANVGVQINLGSKASFLFMPEYRYQLVTSYQKQDDYKHFGRALGFNFGLSFAL